MSIKVELSGGPLGGTTVEWKTAANGKLVDHEEQTFTLDGKKYLYRYAPDPARSPHAVFNGEAKA